MYEFPVSSKLFTVIIIFHIEKLFNEQLLVDFQDENVYIVKVNV